MAGVDEVPHAAIVALDALGQVLVEAGGSGTDLASLCTPVYQELRELGRAEGQTARLVDVVGPDHPLVLATESVDRLFSLVGRAVATEVVSPALGRLDQINSSRGGVPKIAVPAADVGADGLVGDLQRARKVHGRPFQALCLWSTEVIEALVAEGHPVTAGAAGENLTVGGLDWSSMRPGVRMVIGEGEDAVVIELTAWAVPCAKNDQWFRDGDSSRMSQDLHPGWSRAYAAVVQGGAVTTGDQIRVLP